jgi:hydroxymethylpyrimidine pyrophosphatase-like HAD family hydrolase
MGDFVHEYEDDPAFIVLKEPELMDRLSETDIYSAFVFSESGIMEGTIPDDPGLKGAVVQRSSEHSYMITEAGVDKGTGVLRLAEYFGIPQEAILAVGNDENDVPMLKAAGVGVAVANANPDIFAYADWIAPEVGEGGAAAAIRRFAI